MKIVEFIFNTEVDTMPTFNDGFTYTYTDTVNEDGTTTRIIESDTHPTAISFNSMTGLIRLNEIDMTEIAGCYAMFLGCKNLTYAKIDDVSKSVELQGMFMNCTNLETIEGIENWNTSLNESCAAMFSGCNKLTGIDVSNWDMSRVQAIGAMFRYCYALTELDLSKWKTSSTQFMSGIFTKCTGLTKLDLSGFITQCIGEANQVVTMCTNLTELNLSNWILNDENAKRLAVSTNSLSVINFFYKCTSLETIILENTDYFTADRLFDYLPTRTEDAPGTIILSMEEELDDALIAKASAAYWNIEYEQKAHIFDIVSYQFDSSIADLMPAFNDEFTDYTYEDAQMLDYTLRTIKSTQLPTQIKFGDNNLSSTQASSLINVLQLNGTNLEDCSYMFKNCVNLISSIFYLFGNNKVNNVESMFEGCINYNSLIGGAYELPIVSMQNMFKGCHSLWAVNLRNFIITEDTNISNIFEDTVIRSIVCNANTVNYMIDEIPGRTPYTFGEIRLLDESEDVNCIDELTPKHWYIDGVNNIVDLFVVMGQSNAQGQSETYKEFNVPDYQSYTYEYLNDQIAQVKHPFGENIQTLGDVSELGYYQLEGAVGCETGLPYGSLSPHFAAKYYEMTNRPTLIAPCCCGASTIAQWLPGHTHQRYDLTVEKVNKTINASLDVGQRVGGKYLIWLQGESDGIYRTGTTNYKTRFIQLWEALKADLGFEKCFIIRVAKFRPDKYNDKPIIEAQEQLALENDDIFMVTRITGYLEHPGEGVEVPGIQDGVTEGYPYIDHYTWEGYKLVGETAGERIGTYINTGEMPDLEDEPYEGEITSSSEKIIVDYTFDNTVNSDCLPTFGETGYTGYRLVDTVDEGITRRKMIYTELPTEIFFTSDTSLLQVLEINISNAPYLTSLFQACSALTSVKFSKDTTPLLVSLEGSFYQCTALENIDFGGITTDNVTSMAATFSHCSALKRLDIGHWNLENLEAMSATFRNCSTIEKLDLSNSNCKNLIYIQSAFSGCTNLNELILPIWNTNEVLSMNQTFYNCTSLKTLDLNSWTLTSECDLRYMFGNCSTLESLDISNFRITDANIAANTFLATTSLKNIAMLYSDKTSCELIQSLIPTVEGLQRIIYVLDTKANEYTGTDAVQFVDYVYETMSCKIKLPQQLSATDRLYWDEDKRKYCIDANGTIIETDIDRRIIFKGYSPLMIVKVNGSVVPTSITLQVPHNKN